MNFARSWLSRVWNSAVAWSWAYNGLRLASGLLLLPLLLHLPKPDFGIYYVLLSLMALVPLLDLGLLSAIDRTVSYAMGGAVEIKPQGLPAHDGSMRGPNYVLLWKLLHTTRLLYRGLSVVVLVLLGVWGTYTVGLRVDETFRPRLTWVAWGLTLAGCVFDMYAGWWSVYLRGLNKVLLAARIGLVAHLLRFLIASGLLLGGAGLLSIPVATIVSSWVQRLMARHYVLAFLGAEPTPHPARSEVWELLRTLWPNSWRVGLHLFSGYLTVNANTFLCLQYLGLTANGEYGLSVQIVTLCESMAMVWIQVKWPLVFQLRARQNTRELRTLIRPRILLAALTYLLLAGFALACGAQVIHFLGGGKTLLPPRWVALLTVNGFAEMQFTLWTTLILTDNRTPFLWPTVITNLSSLLLVLALLHFSSLGVGALVLGPLIAGGAFNYWYWVRAGAHSLKSSLWRFLLVPERARPQVVRVATEHADEPSSLV